MQDEDSHDRAVEDSFPASDPPASSGVVGPRSPRVKQPGSRISGAMTSGQRGRRTRIGMRLRQRTSGSMRSIQSSS
jgi:hypothetical protein